MICHGHESSDDQCYSKREHACVKASSEAFKEAKCVTISVVLCRAGECSEMRIGRAQSNGEVISHGDSGSSGCAAIIYQMYVQDHGPISWSYLDLFLQDE